MMAMAVTDRGLKSDRLRKFFTGVIDGKRALKNANDARLFLEAVCDRQDRASCIERLVAAPQGLQVLKTSVRSDISSTFINESSARFLEYISDDSVRQLCSGQLLRDVLVAVLDPPTFWTALKNCYNERKLSPSGIQAFASLLLELLSLPPGLVQVDGFEIAERILSAGGLLESSDPDTRSLAYKIQEAVRCKGSNAAAFGMAKPGGRHDNDFEDFRQIAIFPTRDEFSSKEQPFYLPSDVVFGTEPATRAAVHLDNQFRLLREDMLGELRSDLQVTGGNKQGRRTSLRLKNLVFHEIDCGTDRRRRKASIALRCYHGLPKLPGLNEDQRKKYFADNKNLLKHQSLGCLLCQGEIVAFVTVNRNEERLAEDPPIILLEVLGDAALTKTLVTTKTAHQQQIEFVQVDTPFFAYEPILRCLQEKSSLPLASELLGLVEASQPNGSPIALEHIAADIKRREGQNLRHLLNLPKDVMLDHSQTDSLVAGLLQNVSLIQGPPGKS